MQRLVRLFVAIAAVAASAIALPARAAVPRPQAGCAWPLAIEQQRLNVLGPDSGAHYWFLHYSAVPGTRLVIRGQYPDARYFSFTSHDETAVAMASVHDSDIAPDTGSVNPFLTPTSDRQNYTVYVDFGPRPANPAANTLYVGQTLEGYPNPGGLLVYRLYIPTDPTDPQGSAPLPDVSLETNDGAFELAFAQCDSLPPRGVDEPVDNQLRAANRPDALTAVPPPDKNVPNPPRFAVVYAGAFTDPVTNNLPPDAGALVPHRPGVVLGNVDWRYLILNFSRAYGETLVFEAQAPSFVDLATGDLATANKQLRFWSVCNQAALTEAALRTLGCRDDVETTTVPDGSGMAGDGFATRHKFTFVISDAAHRPTANMDGVNWIPWGPWESDSILYRFGLPSNAFTQAPQNVPVGEDPAIKMGAYFPRAAYCSTAAFELVGAVGCLAGH
jgi:hypothetical protein